MNFEEAIRLVEAATRPELLPMEDLRRVPLACALVALEYLSVRERITPA